MQMTVINFQAQREIKDLAHQLAKRDGVSLSGWMRHQIITEARRAGLAQVVEKQHKEKGHDQ